jgi:nucleoside-diphosphate-sugar epimerase
MSRGTVLITGAAGFTGAHMAAELLAAGYRVEGCRESGPALAHAQHRCDLTRPSDVRDLLARVRPDYVVHLAGLSHVQEGDPQSFYRVNLFASLYLLEALVAEHLQPRKVLLASSAQVYGAADREVLDESLCPKPVSHYASSKLAMEHLSATWFDRLPIVITRPFNYTGVGQSDHFVIPKIVNHFAGRLPRIELGRLDVEREFSDVRALCRSYRLLLEAPAQGLVVNVCCGTAYSLRSILDRMAKIAGYQIAVDVNPAFLRTNEIPRLVGSITRLRSTIGTQDHSSIEDTLSWMYANAVAS